MFLNLVVVYTVSVLGLEDTQVDNMDGKNKTNPAPVPTTLLDIKGKEKWSTKLEGRYGKGKRQARLEVRFGQSNLMCRPVPPTPVRPHMKLIDCHGKMKISVCLKGPMCYLHLVGKYEGEPHTDDRLACRDIEQAIITTGPDNLSTYFNAEFRLLKDPKARCGDHYKGFSNIRIVSSNAICTCESPNSPHEYCSTNNEAFCRWQSLRHCEKPYDYRPACFNKICNDILCQNCFGPNSY